MRILLDCRGLTGGNKDNLDSMPGTRTRVHFIGSCARRLGLYYEIDWIFLIDRNQDIHFLAASGNLVYAARGIAGFRQIPRLVKKFGVDKVIRPDDLLFTSGVADERFRVLGMVEKEKARALFAGGKEYFLCDVSKVPPGEIRDILKAFSIFKKRQRSNLQMVLAGAGASLPDQDQYKYRTDLHGHKVIGEQAWREMVGACYAQIIPAGADAPGLTALDGWKAEIPILTTERRCAQDLGESGRLFESALYVAQQGDPTALASLLIMLYTDENQRARLIDRGRSRLLDLDWDRVMTKIGERLALSPINR